MRPPVAQVIPAIPVGLAAAWIGASLFLLPAGSGPLRSLPVGPVADLVTGPVVAALGPAVRPPAAASPALEPTPAARTTGKATTSVNHPRSAVRRAQPRAVRRDIPQRSVPAHPAPPTSTPVSVPAAPRAAATPRAHGKAKALRRVREHSPPGLSQSSGTGPVDGPGHSTEKEHGHGAPPSDSPHGGGNTGDGGGGHGRGGQ
jgi:hypothetical protein